MYSSIAGHGENALVATIYPMTQSLFVNKQTESTSQQVSPRDTKAENPSATRQMPIEGEFIKIGDSVSFSQAENLFDRANKYAELSNNAQNGLQAYTAIDTENKREALRRLMGVDLYA